MRKILAVILCVLAVVALALVIGKHSTTRDDLEPVSVTVQSGDTAWTIAKAYCPEDVDVRDYLAWCADENGMNGMGNIEAGKTYTFLEVAK